MSVGSPGPRRRYRRTVVSWRHAASDRVDRISAAPARTSSSASLLPERAGSPPVRRRVRRIARRPSGQATTACIVRPPRSCTAMAPSGSWQPPPSAVTTARSAGSETAAAHRWRRHRIARARVVVANLNRHDTLSGCRYAHVDRDCGGDARAKAEPEQAGRGKDQRVILSAVELAQPGIDVSANRRERGLRQDRGSCAMRRTLPVPIVGISPRCASAPSKSTTVVPLPAPARRADLRGQDRRDRQSSGSTADMSFALCTARSMSPASSASSISLTNSRLPPASEAAPPAADRRRS